MKDISWNKDHINVLRCRWDTDRQYRRQVENLAVKRAMRKIESKLREVLSSIRVGDDLVLTYTFYIRDEKLGGVDL